MFDKSKIKTTFVRFLFICVIFLFSCSPADNLYKSTGKELFLKSKSSLLTEIGNNISQEFISSAKFDKNGKLSTFKYLKMENYLGNKKFKSFLVNLQKDTTKVAKIILIGKNGKQETLYNNRALVVNNRPMDRVYLIKDKKNYRRGGCKPRSGWICEIRVKDDHTILVGN